MSKPEGQATTPTWAQARGSFCQGARSHSIRSLFILTASSALIIGQIGAGAASSDGRYSAFFYIGKKEQGGMNNLFLKIQRICQPI